MGPHSLEDFRVGIQPVRPDVHGKGTLLRHDVVPGPRLDLGDGHFHRSEVLGHLGETVGPEPFDVRKCLIQCVDAFFPGGLPAPSGRHAVEDQQPPLRDGHLHPGRFADDAEVHGAGLREDPFNAAGPAHLLFGGGAENEPVGLPGIFQ